SSSSFFWLNNLPSALSLSLVLFFLFYSISTRTFMALLSVYNVHGTCVSIFACIYNAQLARVFAIKEISNFQTILMKAALFISLHTYTIHFFLSIFACHTTIEKQKV